MEWERGRRPGWGLHEKRAGASPSLVLTLSSLEPFVCLINFVTTKRSSSCFVVSRQVLILLSRFTLCGFDVRCKLVVTYEAIRYPELTSQVSVYHKPYS